MARSDKGSELSTKLLQPGWTIQSDGFGLNTCSATYKVNASDAPAINVRGDAFPKSEFSYLKAHKSSISYDDLGMATMRIDYVGIDPTVNSGAWTNANTSSANGLTAENITSHPAFFEGTAPFSSSIAGPPDYTEDASGEFAPKVGTGYGFLGQNGACFEKKKGGRFIGFVKPEFKPLYGKTQYLASTTTYSGVMYVNTHQSARIFLDYLGSANVTATWGSFVLLPPWAEVGAGTYGNKNLLSQVNVEEYGSLYKVMYEIRYSREGWSPLVYWNI